MLQIIRKSPRTGHLNAMDLDITLEQMEQYEAGKGYIQDIFCNLSASQREFIKTGYTEEDWKEIFGAD